MSKTNDNLSTSVLNYANSLLEAIQELGVNNPGEAARLVEVQLSSFSNLLSELASRVETDRDLSMSAFGLTGSKATKIMVELIKAGQVKS